LDCSSRAYCWYEGLKSVSSAAIGHPRIGPRGNARADKESPLGKNRSVLSDSHFERESFRYRIEISIDIMKLGKYCVKIIKCDLAQCIPWQSFGFSINVTLFEGRTY
jgi:hypothetical protein